jgi:hypothetical protein
VSDDRRPRRWHLYGLGGAFFVLAVVRLLFGNDLLRFVGH